MKFMNVIAKFTGKNDMINFRNKMLDEAEALLNEGKMDEYNAKMEDIKTFDDEYEQYTENKANIEAMKGAASVKNMLTEDAKNGIIDAVRVSAEDTDRAYRNAFMTYLKNNGVQTTFHYLPLHSSKFYHDKHGCRPLPECDRYADTLVRLPLFYELSDEDIQLIIELITTYVCQ